MGGPLRSVPPPPGSSLARFLRPSPPLRGGREESAQKRTNKPVLATHSAPEPCRRHQQKTSPLLIVVRLVRRWQPAWSRSAQRTNESLSSLRGVKRRSNPGAACIKRWIASLTLAMTRGSGTPKGADIQPPHLAVQRASGGTRTPLGVPPRFLPKGLLIPKAQLRPGFVGGGAETRRVAPANAAPSSSDAPRTPVIVPAGMMPEPPECAGDEPTPAGTALAPPTGVTGRRPSRERDS